MDGGPVADVVDLKLLKIDVQADAAEDVADVATADSEFAYAV